MSRRPEILEVLRADADDDAIRQRLARLQNGHADAHSDAERLRGESRRLAEHYASVRAVTRAQWDARRAALNLLEDAEEARSAERRELAERRRADTALRASEEQYRALFERMDEGYGVIEVLFDAAGRPEDFVLLDANPAFEVQTGLRMIGRRIREVIPSYEQLWLDNYGGVATTGAPLRFEGFVGGSGRWFETSAFRLGAEDSRRVAVLLTNVTERKQAEERQRRAAASDAFRVALADALRPLHDPLDIQAAAAHILGRHLGASRVHYAEVAGESFVIERGYTDGVAPLTERVPLADLAPASLEALRAGRILAVADVAGDADLGAAHGEALLTRSIAALVGVPLVKDGRLAGMLTVHQSTARVWTVEEVALAEETGERVWAAVERARAEAALRESEARLRTAVGLAQLGICDWDWSADEMRGNPTRFEMCGLDPAIAVLRARDFVALLHPEDRVRVWPRILEGLETRGEYAEIFRIVRPDGIVRWISEAGRVSTWRDGRPLLVNSVLFDITTHREAEANVRESAARLRTLADDAERARAEAEAAGQAKDHFLAVLSHELRTPLTPIQMALGMLSRRLDLPAPVRAAHEMITRNVELEAHFINDMLDMTRIARGKMEIVREDMDLHEAARRAVEVSLPDLEAKKQRLTVALDAADHRVNGDHARLQQALWNLLKNASKFTPGGGEISLRTRNEPRRRIVVEVADNGMGIDPAVIDRVFRPFEQADGSITQRFGGLGLGLAIAKGTVDAHGGDLRARSAGVGHGATFTMELPVQW